MQYGKSEYQKAIDSNKDNVGGALERFQIWEFCIRRGLRRGDFFSSVLFNPILEIIVRRSGLKAKEIISL